MQKTTLIFAAAAAVLLPASCGHNITTYSKGVGVELSWRAESIMPSLRAGSYESLDAVHRENTQVRYTSNIGFDFLWVNKLLSLLGGKQSSDFGNGTVLEIKTGPQFNGYVRDVLRDNDVTPEKAAVAASVCSVNSGLGDRETRMGLGEVAANATPVVVTERGALGSSTVTTPVDEITRHAIEKQVTPSGILDVVDSLGRHVVYGAVALVAVIMLFALVYLLRTGKKISELKKSVQEILGK